MVEPILSFINLGGNSLNGGSDLLTGSISTCIGTYLAFVGNYTTNASLLDVVASNK